MGDYLQTPDGPATNGLMATGTTIGSYRMCPETNTAELPGRLRLRV